MGDGIQDGGIIWDKLGSSEIIRGEYLGSSGSPGISWDHRGRLWEELGEVSGRTLASLWVKLRTLWQLWALRGLLRGLWEVSEKSPPQVLRPGQSDAC